MILKIYWIIQLKKKNKLLHEKYTNFDIEEYFNTVSNNTNTINQKINELNIITANNQGLSQPGLTNLPNSQYSISADVPQQLNGAQLIQDSTDPDGNNYKLKKKQEILHTRNRMLQLSQERNIYKKKVIYVLLTIIISIFIIIMAIVSKK